MSCCTNTYNLGCFNHCGSISFGEATSTETLTAVVEFANQANQLEIDITNGDPYLIPLSGLNEDAFFTMKLYDDSGAVHTITIDEVVYDCFTFKTRVIYGATVSTTVSTTCCAPRIIEVTGLDEYTVTYSQFQAYGSIPNIQVVVKVGATYQRVDFQPTYDQMPDPQNITITINGTPPDTWYIIIS